MSWLDISGLFPLWLHGVDAERQLVLLMVHLETIKCQLYLCLGHSPLTFQVCFHSGKFILDSWILTSFSLKNSDISGARSTKSLEYYKLHHFMEFRDVFSWWIRMWKFFICFLGMEGYGIYKACRLNRKWPVRNLKNMWRKTPHHRQKTGNKIIIFFS